MQLILILIVFFTITNAMLKQPPSTVNYNLFPRDLIDLIFNKPIWQKNNYTDQMIFINTQDHKLSIRNSQQAKQLLSTNWQNLTIQIMIPGLNNSVKFQNQIFKKEPIHFSRRSTTTSFLTVDMPAHTTSVEIENGKIQLDGPNDEKIIATAATTDEPNYHLYLFTLDKNKNSIEHFVTSLEITALALGKSRLALAHGQMLSLFALDKAKTLKNIALESCPEEFKKISFISQETFLALAKSGQFYVGYTKNNTICFKKQNIVNSNIMAKNLDFAVDVAYPWHVALLQEVSKKGITERQLFLADLKKISKNKVPLVFLSSSKTQYEHKNLWFNNHTVGINTESNNLHYLTVIKTLLLTRKEITAKFSEILQRKSIL